MNKKYASLGFFAVIINVLQVNLYCCLPWNSHFKPFKITEWLRPQKKQTLLYHQHHHKSFNGSRLEVLAWSSVSSGLEFEPLTFYPTLNNPKISRKSIRYPNISINLTFWVGRFFKIQVADQMCLFLSQYLLSHSCHIINIIYNLLSSSFPFSPKSTIV